jgi:hypothetical protein
MFARGAGAGTEAQAGSTLLRVDVGLDAWAGAGGVTEAVACSVSTYACSVLFASSLSLYPFARIAAGIFNDVELRSCLAHLSTPYSFLVETMEWCLSWSK